MVLGTNGTGHVGYVVFTVFFLSSAMILGSDKCDYEHEH